MGRPRDWVTVLYVCTYILICIISNDRVQTKSKDETRPRDVLANVLLEYRTEYSKVPTDISSACKTKYICIECYTACGMRSGTPAELSASELALSTEGVLTPADAARVLLDAEYAWPFSANCLVHVPGEVLHYCSQLNVMQSPAHI